MLLNYFGGILSATRTNISNNNDDPPPTKKAKVDTANKNDDLNPIKDLNDAMNATKDDTAAHTVVDLERLRKQDVTNSGNGNQDRNIPQFVLPINGQEQQPQDDTDASALPPGYYTPTLSDTIREYLPSGLGFLVNDGGTELLAAMFERQFIIVVNIYLLIQFTDLYRLLSAMFCTGILCVQYLSRGGGTTGKDKDRLKCILMKVAVFRRLLLCLMSIFLITGMWMFCNLSGEHPYHSDGFAVRATHRYVY